MKKIVKSVFIYLLVFICCMTKVMYAEAGTYVQDTQCHAISIALDVSGSMKKTDAKRHSIELIKLFMDLCKETDYLSVTAYNDTIV